MNQKVNPYENPVAYQGDGMGDAEISEHANLLNFEENM